MEFVTTFFKSLVDLGRDNPLALLLVVLAIVASIGFIGSLAGVRWIEGKNKKIDAKIKADERHEDSRQETERRKSTIEERRLDLIAEQTKQLGRLVDNIERLNRIDDEKTKELAATRGELIDQGDTLDTIEALTLAQKNTLDVHRKEVQPTLDEITSQGQRLHETNKLLTALDDSVKALPVQVRQAIKPDLDDLIKRLDTLGQEMQKVVDDFDSARRSIIEAITKVITPPEPIPSLLSGEGGSVPIITPVIVPPEVKPQ